MQPNRIHQWGQKSLRWNLQTATSPSSRYKLVPPPWRTWSLPPQAGKRRTAGKWRREPAPWPQMRLCRLLRPGTAQRATPPGAVTQRPCQDPTRVSLSLTFVPSSNKTWPNTSAPRAKQEGTSPTWTSPDGWGTWGSRGGLTPRRTRGSNPRCGSSSAPPAPGATWTGSRCIRRSGRSKTKGKGCQGKISLSDISVLHWKVFYVQLLSAHVMFCPTPGLG